MINWNISSKSMDQKSISINLINIYEPSFEQTIFESYEWDRKGIRKKLVLERKRISEYFIQNYANLRSRNLH
jgi:hypothetical protein